MTAFHTSEGLLGRHRHPHQGRLRSATRVLAAATSSETRPRAKRASVSELRDRIKSLQEENLALRRTLASFQGCTPDDVVFEDAWPETQHATPTQPGTNGTSRPADMESYPQPIEDAEEEARVHATELSLEELKTRLRAGIRWPLPGETAFWERPPRESPLPLPASLAGSSSTTMPARPGSTHFASPRGTPLHVVHVTAEMAPVAKVGGLGDVVTGLAKASLARGCNVEIILPYYECLEGCVESVQLDAEFDCPKGRTQDGVFQPGSLPTQAFTGRIDGCPVVLIRPDWGASGSTLFRGSRIYGGSYNEAEAYLYFSRAALEWLAVTGRSPDVVHAHEWQCAAVPMLFWEVYGDRPGLGSARPVLTIHNIDNSGECRQDEFSATGIPGEQFATVDKALDERTVGHNPERLCLLKGGIVYASAVTTVSPTYARETLEGGAAGWLRSTLARPDVMNKYFGVLNGCVTIAMLDAPRIRIDASFLVFLCLAGGSCDLPCQKQYRSSRTAFSCANRVDPLLPFPFHFVSSFPHRIDTEAWDPATDPLLPANFSAAAPFGKSLCKSFLRRGLGLDDTVDKPLVAVVSRLVPQKGIHLVGHSFDSRLLNAARRPNSSRTACTPFPMRVYLYRSLIATAGFPMESAAFQMKFHLPVASSCRSSMQPGGW
jgi:glycogen synthase